MLIKRKYLFKKYISLNDLDKYKYLSKLKKRNIRILFNLKRKDFVPDLPDYDNFLMLFTYNLEHDGEKIIEWVDKHINFIYNLIEFKQDDINKIVLAICILLFNLKENKYFYVDKEKVYLSYFKLIERFIINKNESVKILIEDILEKNLSSSICTDLVKSYEKYENDKYLKIKLKYIYKEKEILCY